MQRVPYIQTKQEQIDSQNLTELELDHYDVMYSVQDVPEHRTKART